MKKSLLFSTMAVIAAHHANKTAKADPMTTTLTNDQITAGAAVLCGLLTNALRECANALAYAAYNIDGKTLDELDPRLSESTGVSDSCLIAERTARAALAEAKMVALAPRTPYPQIAEKVELLPLPILQDAAQAINRLLGAVEGLSYVDSAREFGERTLTNILRITEAAPASAGQAAPADPCPLHETLDGLTPAEKAESERILAELRAMPIEDVAAMVRGPIYLAAQPAEGAGQAGQVATAWAHKRKDGSGYGAWVYASEAEAEREKADNEAGDCYEVVGMCEVAAPTERAAAPADLIDAERWRRWLPWMRNLNKKPFNLAKEIAQIDATNQPSAQVKQ